MASCQAMLSCLQTRHSLGRDAGRVSVLRRRAKARAPQHKRSGVSTAAAFDFFRRKITTSGAVDDILASVTDTERGCSTSRSQRASIDAAVATLEEAGNNAGFAGNGLSATWKLLWTTEKVC